MNGPEERLDFLGECGILLCYHQRVKTMSQNVEHHKMSVEILRRFALENSDVEETIACEGTVLESSAFQIRKKTFLFLRIAQGTLQARLKLSQSQSEASVLAAKEPSHYQIGVHGWVAIKFKAGEPLPQNLLERWIQESYFLLAGTRAAGTKDNATLLPRKTDKVRKQLV